MSDNSQNLIIDKIIASIDIPDSAYEKAEARYKNLGEWFERSEAHCGPFSPHIFPQGSFRLGTVIRPLDSDGEYDLDISCRLRAGLTKSNVTQEQLKELVGVDVEEYRAARGIKDRKERKHRCWRLNYADTLKFHLDIVPSIPESVERRRLIKEAIIQTRIPDDLAITLADLSVSITDDRLANYRFIDDNWKLSNLEGFALWFEYRMKLAKSLLESRALQAKAARIDDLPAYRWKSPLQRCVQILKRHRDIEFASDPDGKPASIIITTLAARAYQGETEVADALHTILTSMGALVSPTTPRVPNPVNPAEDFTDRWRDPSSSHRNLEVKFWRWLQKAQSDFDAIVKERSPELLTEAARSKFGVSLDPKELRGILGVGVAGGLLKPAVAPSGLSFPDKPLVPKKPAGFA